MVGGEDPAHGGCFNPTLVRLRCPPQLLQALPSQMFQSHAGSIEVFLDRQVT